jgi:DNA-directed RNA polymerase subunit RPC12/RpoP
MDIKCTQCGAGIEITEESGFITCPYCDSRLYLEADRTVRHFYLKPEIRHDQLAAIIGKELFSRELKGPVEIASAEPLFIPYWLIRLKEGILHFPAAELTNTELQQFVVPVGKLEPYEEGLEKKYKMEMPHLSLDDLMKKPAMEQAKDSIERSDLIHIPFFKVFYHYDQGTFQTMIDAGEGRMYAEKLPRGLSHEKDRYFMTLFLILSAVFMGEAMLMPHFWEVAISYLVTGVIAWYFIHKVLDAKGY